MVSLESIKRDLDLALDNYIDDAVDFLCELIKFPSTRGNEGQVNKYIFERMKSLCDNAELIQIPDSIINHPDYNWQQEQSSYQDTYNVRLKLFPKLTKGKSLIINAHSDVVPPSRNQDNAFMPKVKNGKIFGRGACDDKGQIAALFLLLRCLQKLKLKPGGEITIDIVVEEENGGNGTLFALQNQTNADGAIVLEPSEFKIHPSVRGAVWFEIACVGKPTHSGSTQRGVSALLLAFQAMKALEKYHDQLLKESRGLNKLFDEFSDPMPLTFGMLNAGDWPATIPATASVKGVFGFLPNYSIKEIQKGIRETILNSVEESLKKNFEIKFPMLNNEGYQISEDHPLVTTLYKAEQLTGLTPVISAMTASCDAWKYVHMLKIPTVVLGAGSLSFAHSNEEQIKIEDIRKLSKILFYFLGDWCKLIAH